MKKVFLLYDCIRATSILEPLNSRELQRLRKSNKRSFDVPYSGTPRFSHSLGVYEIAVGPFAITLHVNYATQEEGDGLWDDSNRLVVLCAASCMMVGTVHAHTFEKIFDTNHEQESIDIIFEESKSIRFYK